MPKILYTFSKFHHAIMFKFGDYVLNQQTGHLGKVIGYGHQLINDIQTVTLKVLVAETTNSQKYEFVVEDEISAWNPWCVASNLYKI